MMYFFAHRPLQVAGPFPCRSVRMPGLCAQLIQRRGNDDAIQYHVDSRYAIALLSKMMRASFSRHGVAHARQFAASQHCRWRLMLPCFTLCYYVFIAMPPRADVFTGQYIAHGYRCLVSSTTVYGAYFRRCVVRVLPRHKRRLFTAISIFSPFRHAWARRHEDGRYMPAHEE